MSKPTNEIEDDGAFRRVGFFLLFLGGVALIFTLFGLTTMLFRESAVPAVFWYAQIPIIVVCFFSAWRMLRRTKPRSKA